MEFFKIRKDIPFMRHALTFNLISIAMFLLAVGALAFKGLNLGVEFTGGTVMEVGYSESANLSKIRKSLESGGMSEAMVQSFGDSRTVLIRLPTKPELTGAKLSDQVFLMLKEDDPQLELRRVDYVGSQVGEELVEKGALALLVVSLGIVIYLAFRFEWKFGLAAILANLHDVVIILGFFALFQWGVLTAGARSCLGYLGLFSE